MLAAKVVGKERIELEEGEKPQVDEYRNCLVKVLYCGICGSDMPKYYGNRIKRYPLVLGHEMCGIVEEGPEHLVGKLVSVIPMWYCGECDNCKADNYELCTNHLYLGSTIDGAMQEYITVPEKYILKCSEIKNKKLAALIEPFAVAIHTVNQVYGNCQYSKIAIVGDGVIGRLVYLSLILYGHVKKESIELFGPNDFPKENSYDMVFECSGKVGGFNKAIKICKYKASIVQVGIIYSEFFKGNEDVDFDKLLRKELLLKGIWNSNFHGDWELAKIIISNNEEKFEELITDIFLLEDVEEAFKYKNNTHGYEKVLKTMLNVGDK